MRLARSCLRAAHQTFRSESCNDLKHFRSMATMGVVHGPTVAFIGLGAMGYQMAKRLAIRPVEPDEDTLASSPPDHHPGARLHRGSSIHRGMQDQVMRRVLVWNRTKDIAAQHAEEFRSVDITGQDFSGLPVSSYEGADPLSLGDASIVFMCLPTSEITFGIVKEIAPHLASDAIVVDCCTGHPNVTREIADYFKTSRPGVSFMDCPISGGPGGASKGTLAAMLGGTPESAEKVWPHVSAFAANVVHLGPVGAGHAVKVVNNACNVSNLLCLHEGLLALKKMGVDPTAALKVINKSSGRSLMSQDRVPQEVISGDWNYGFKLGLMAKDVSIATELMDEYYPKAECYRRTLKVHFDAMAAGTVHYDSDYTEIVKHQELQAGATLRSEASGTEPGKPPAKQSAKALESKVNELLDQNKALRAELEAAKRVPA